MILISLIGLQARSESFSCIIHDAEVTGTDSTLICRIDGDTIEMDVPEGIRLKGIEAFGEGIIGIAEGGYILFWDSPFDKARKRLFELKGEFTGIDAWENTCYAVTDSSEILSLNLALQGKIFDFNSNYSDYYGNVILIDIAAGPEAVCIAVVREDGSPTAFVSSKGSVWSERELSYSIDGEWFYFNTVPDKITYEESSDSFVLICKDGVRFHLPSCSHCNYIEKIW